MQLKLNQFSIVFFIEMELRQIRYDQETQRGDKKETQEHWEAVVELELAKYEFYKSN